MTRPLLPQRQAHPAPSLPPAPFSFFPGQPKVMPAYMRGSPLPFLPEIAVIAAMVFRPFRGWRWL